MIRVILILFLLTSSANADCKYSATADVINDKQNFEGWTCGAITACGEYGDVCGGFGTKNGDSEIKKTYDVPVGNYTVTLDYIKIDDWFVFKIYLSIMFFFFKLTY